ncbi:hypothetical protein HN51_012365, partial [Arachis hypogaea]
MASSTHSNSIPSCTNIVFRLSGLKVYFLEEQNSMYGLRRVDSQSSPYSLGWLNGLAKQKQLEPIKCKTAGPVVQIACSVMVSWSKKVGDPYVRECSRRNYSSHSEADVEDKEMDGDAGVSLFCLTRRVLENELEFGIELED